MKRIWKRAAALFLAMALTVSIMPAYAFAAEVNPTVDEDIEIASETETETIMTDDEEVPEEVVETPSIGEEEITASDDEEVSEAAEEDTQKEDEQEVDLGEEEALDESSEEQESESEDLDEDLILEDEEEETEVALNSFDMLLPASTKIMTSDFFPDKAFLAAMIKYFGEDYTAGDARTYNNSIDVSGKGISSLKGIDLFPNIKYLYAYDNKIEELELINFDKLEKIEIFNNKLTSLNLSGDTSIKVLECYNNELTSLELPVADYEEIDIANNRLTEMPAIKTKTVSHTIEAVDAHGNPFEKVTIELNCKLLEELELQDCGITELQLKGKFQDVRISSNKLRFIDLSQASVSYELSLSGNSLYGVNLGSNSKGILDGIGQQTYPAREAILDEVNGKYYVSLVDEDAVLEAAYENGFLQFDSEVLVDSSSAIAVIPYDPEKSLEDTCLSFDVYDEHGDKLNTWTASAPLQIVTPTFQVNGAPIGSQKWIMDTTDSHTPLKLSFSSNLDWLTGSSINFVLEAVEMFTSGALDIYGPSFNDGCWEQNIYLQDNVAFEGAVGLSLCLRTQIDGNKMIVYQEYLGELEIINAKTELTGVSLLSNKTTVNLFSDNYAMIGLSSKMEPFFPKEYAAVSPIRYPEDKDRENHSYMIFGAYFNNSEANAAFQLVMNDDYSFKIVPKDDFLNFAKNYPKSIPSKLSAHVMVTMKDERAPIDAGVLTININKKLPTVTAKAIKFNSNLCGDSAKEIPITFNGGKVKEIVNVESAPLKWLELDTEKKTLRYTGEYGKKYSTAKITMHCFVEGCNVERTVKVSVSAAAVKPTISLKKKAVTYYTATNSYNGDTIYIPMTFKNCDFDYAKITIKEGKKDITNDSGNRLVRIYINDDMKTSGSGSIEIRQNQNSDNKKHKYVCSLKAGGASVSFTINIVPAANMSNPTISAKVSGSVGVYNGYVFSTSVVKWSLKNTAFDGGCRVDVTEIYSLDAKKNKVDLSDKFRIRVAGEWSNTNSLPYYDSSYRNSSGSIRIIPKDSFVPESGKTYYMHLELGNFDEAGHTIEKNIQFTCNMKKPAAPKLTAKVKGTLDNTKYSPIKITTSLKGYENAASYEILVYKTYDGETKQATSQYMGGYKKSRFYDREDSIYYTSTVDGTPKFDLSVTNSGSSNVWTLTPLLDKGFCMHTGDKYRVDIIVGNPEVAKTSVSLGKVKTSKIKLKPSKSTIILTRDNICAMETFTLTGASNRYVQPADFNISGPVQDAASAKNFYVTNADDHTLVLLWEHSNVVNAAKLTKTQTVKITVRLEGGAKYTFSVKVKPVLPKYSGL